eukprot:s3_g29.t1
MACNDQSKLSSTDQGLCRKLLNGAHITQDGKHYCNSSPTDECEFCGCSDSRFHRFWQCSHFHFARDDVPEDVLRLIPQLPEALTCFGWSLRPATLRPWYAMLAQIAPVEAVPVAQAGSVLHLFTDGSCVHQHSKWLRFAAWSVVAAGCTGDMSHSQVCAAGPLPGILQNAYRVEVYAIFQALEVAREADARVMIWTDCAAVHKRFVKLLAGEVPQPSWSHSDLWTSIHVLLVSLGTERFGITKVAAHQSPDGLTAFEEWCFSHNTLADRAAVRANFARPRSFWEFYAKHVSVCNGAMAISFHVQQVLLRVSRAAVQYEELRDVTPEPAVVEEIPAAPFWRGLGPMILPKAASRWYGEPVVRQVMSWFWSVLTAVEGPVLWVSQFQLYLDFQMSTGLPGPVHQSKWWNGEDVPLLSLQGFAFKTRCRWFIKVLKQCLRHGGQHCHYRFGLPHSLVLRLHTGTLALPWPIQRLEMIDQWLLTFLPQGVRRTGQSLDALPLVTRSEQFPIVQMSTEEFQ